MGGPRDIRQRFTRLPGAELRSTWQSRQAYKRHSHPQLSIGAIVEGETLCVCGGEEYLLGPGDLIVIPANVAHSCNPLNGRPRSYHMLYIDTHLAPGQQAIGSPALFALYQQIVKQMRPEDIADLLAALPAIAQAQDARRSISLQMRQALLEDLQHPPSLNALAQRFSLRKETLIRLFRRDTGLTPGHFLAMSRVEYAKARLRAGDEIADVGYQSGFADQSHFHKTFVSFTAATPRQYATGQSISDNKRRS